MAHCKKCGRFQSKEDQTFGDGYCKKCRLSISGPKPIQNLKEVLFMKWYHWVILAILVVVIVFGVFYVVNQNKLVEQLKTTAVEQLTATSEPTTTPEPTATPIIVVATATPISAAAIPTTTGATNSSEAIGFTPDKDLLISDLKAEKVGLESASLTRDFQKYLNENRDGFGPLAGFTDGVNDYNQYNDHKSAPQVPAYSWMVHTGEYVEIPGIGTVTGEKGRGVIVLIINRTDKVYRFPTNSVTVIAGFQGWGRIWNGESNEVVETEKRLVNHYLTRLGEGVPETGFIGQTDNGADNAITVTVVTVEMLDMGQFRLIRAETVPAIKN